MSKYRFKESQRYAIWLHHGSRCYWCHEPLRYLESTIDHVIQEYIETNPDELNRVAKLFNLSKDFSVNSFANWLPCHEHCNRSKSGKVFNPTPLLMGILEKLGLEAEKVAKVEERIKREKEADKLLGKVAIALQDNLTSTGALLQILANPPVTTNLDIATIRQEIKFHIDPKRWKIVENQGDTAYVSDGQDCGRTPIGKNPDISWQCPFCDSYGPWSGVRCLNCGHRSTPLD